MAIMEWQAALRPAKARLTRTTETINASENQGTACSRLSQAPREGSVGTDATTAGRGWVGISGAFFFLTGGGHAFAAARFLGGGARHKKRTKRNMLFREFVSRSQPTDQHGSSLLRRQGSL